MIPDKPNLHPELPGIDDRIGPIPAERTRMLYGPELPIFFVKGQRKQVVHGDNIIAGREKTHCQLLLTSIAAARCHARFILKDNTWYLSDLNSTNGVFLNGHRLKCDQEYYLLPGDEIVFADEKVIFDYHKEHPIPTPIPAPPSPSGIPSPPVPFPMYLPAYGIHRLTGLILCYRNNWGIRTLHDEKDPLILHDSFGKKLQLHYGDIDLSDGVAVFLDHSPHPEQHAVFYYSSQDGIWSLMDCGTFEGTSINGNPLTAYQKYPLSPGDTIYFGKTATYTFGDRTLVNKYQIVRLLENGPWTKTYLVEHQKLSKTFIAKILDKAAPGYTSVMREHFLHVSKLTMPLQHPMIPRIVDLIEDHRCIIAVTEHIPGNTLRKILEKNGPFSADVVISMGIELCSVLGYLHDLNPPRIHRDIKPSNIILQPDGRLKLIDFDSMICCKEDKMAFALPIGTPGYAAPEQYLTAKLTPATDIYGLGVVLHQLITGKDPCCPPYECLPIRKINPDLPKRLEKIIQKCTQLNPQERYQTCAALQADLKNANDPMPFLTKFHR